jgi:hypothetical protein
MRHKPRFRLWRPGRRSTRRQVAALRAKTAQARQQLADTDAMLAAGRPERKSLCATSSYSPWRSQLPSG